ncbi:unnamed protein product [Durusdinium trenchii]|uniref:RING-type domain-containing protein n=2 Tax=Durusdinium trenchii TaxID=1381693 RepID=A0ABP0R879_9DINO
MGQCATSTVAIEAELQAPPRAAAPDADARPTRWPAAPLYRVLLERSGVEVRWGMKLGVHPEIEGLVITELTSSLVEEWNDEHPELCIQEGHVIVEVNGFQDHPSMKQELAKATSLDLLMRPIRSDLQQLAFNVFKRKHCLSATLHPADVPPDQDLGGCSICHDAMVVEQSGADQIEMAHDGAVTAHAESQRVVRLACKHHFHESCVKRWLLTGNHRCPLCNYQLDLRP